jgi:hypothetical protein
VPHYQVRAEILPTVCRRGRFGKMEAQQAQRRTGPPLRLLRLLRLRSFYRMIETRRRLDEALADRYAIERPLSVILSEAKDLW